MIPRILIQALKPKVKCGVINSAFYHNDIQNSAMFQTLYLYKYIDKCKNDEIY